MRALHETAIALTVKFEDIPRVAPRDRIELAKVAWSAMIIALAHHLGNNSPDAARLRIGQRRTGTARTGASRPTGTPPTTT